MTRTVTINGTTYDYEAFEAYMDEEIREALHYKLAPCTDQEFMDAYLKAHEAKYPGEDFVEAYGYEIDETYVITWAKA